MAPKGTGHPQDLRERECPESGPQAGFARSAPRSYNVIVVEIVDPGRSRPAAQAQAGSGTDASRTAPKAAGLEPSPRRNGTGARALCGRVGRRIQPATVPRRSA